MASGYMDDCISCILCRHSMAKIKKKKKKKKKERKKSLQGAERLTLLTSDRKDSYRTQTALELDISS